MHRSFIGYTDEKSWSCIYLYFDAMGEPTSIDYLTRRGKNPFAGELPAQDGACPANGMPEAFVRKSQEWGLSDFRRPGVLFYKGSVY
jgi:hypothetical protein